jgi:molybdate/tungstate transport system substrate-binding protein
VRLIPIALAFALLACGGRIETPKPPITVFAAASLARPLRVLADSFQQQRGYAVLIELGGSMEQSRKITDLGRVPDALLLVDDEVIAALMPAHLDWYARFATNRIGILYTPRSRFADSITAENWWGIVTRPDVQIGRADPSVAPVGKHALSMVRLAETYYRKPDLADSIMARAPLKNVRPNATELAALLETGEVDYILDYESVAKQYGFRFVELPQDLAPAILYGISVPRLAAQSAAGTAFVAYVLSDEGKRILSEAQISVLRIPVALGTNLPGPIADRVRSATSH